MPDLVLIKRHNQNVPFGFKLQGGQDFSVPLSILEITPGTIADQVGLRPGDAILKINNIDTNWMEHNRAKQEIMNAGNEFWLLVERNSVNTFKPQVTPLSALKTRNPVNNYAVPPPIKTSLAADKMPTINIGNSHNRAPMPFNRNVGSSVVYQAQKADNWKEGDYMHLNEPSHNAPINNAPPQSQYNPLPHQYNPQPQHYNPTQQQYNSSEAPTMPQLHQYNSPVGLYSKANLMQEIRSQTKVNTSHNQQKTLNNMSQQQPQTQMQQRPQPQPQIQMQPRPQPQQPQKQQNYANRFAQGQTGLRSSSQSRASGSLSMIMLNKDLRECEGTNQQATSVFDLKSGNNPTGASVPRGFRSVMAPVELPPDQRHAPMHKEYQVHHVKSNWIEPKML